jgi:hypothetical protein
MACRIEPVIDIGLQAVWNSTGDDTDSLAQLSILLVTELGPSTPGKTVQSESHWRSLATSNEILAYHFDGMMLDAARIRRLSAR